MIGWADIGSDGFYRCELYDLNRGDTVRLKFKNNRDSPSLAEIHFPDVRGGIIPILNFPPTIHCRRNSTEPLINFTTYRVEDFFFRARARGHIYVVCFTKNNPNIVVDTINLSPSYYQHAMHLHLQLLPDPDSVKFIFVRDGEDINYCLIDSIPRDGGWLDARKNGDDVIMLKKFYGEPGGRSNNVYDTIHLYGILVIKPHDIEVKSVNAPRQVSQGKIFTAKVHVKNNKWFNAQVPLVLNLFNPSGDSIETALKIDTLGPFEHNILDFEVSTRNLPPGNYKIVAIARANNDQNTSNDTASTQIEIVPGPPPGWQERSNVPPGPKNKKCKEGTDACSDAYYNIHLFKGGTLEYYVYDPNQNIWIQRTDLPAGKRGKAKKGSSIIYADGKIYFKHGNSEEFYRKDTAIGAPWESLASFTFNNKNVKVKDGTDLVWDGRDTLFMTCGNISYNKKAIVAKYDIKSNSWTYEFFPFVDKFKGGTSMAFSPIDSSIWLVPGKTRSIYRRTREGTWEKVVDIPDVPEKKPKSIAWLDSSIYVAVGGKEGRNFVRYNLATNNWELLQSFPSIKGKQPKRPVLVSTEEEIYGLGGNNTNNFFVYNPPPLLSFSCLENKIEKIKNNKEETIIVKSNDYDSYVISGKIPCNGYIYDITGKKVGEVNKGVLNISNLRPGIYYLQTKDDRKEKIKSYKIVVK
ncbi:MAG: T9SS type A sorting domain-containing protein [Candidatus Pacearchaeota archaeon]|nr:T9SS type A sorting domain-containing protein [Candidatus Pacearchaeota archaeon]